MTAFILDTETTGTSYVEICELAYLQIPNKVADLLASTALPDLVKDQFVSRFKPSKPITAITSAIHGIYDKDVRGCQPTSTLRMPPDAKVIICHNVAYDRRVLQAHYAREGLDFPVNHWLCTLQMSRKIQKLSGKVLAANNKLLTLFHVFYPDWLAQFKSKSHGALADSQMTLLVLIALLKLCPPMETLEDVALFFENL